MLTCPLCGAPETDRVDLEGRRVLVFGCMFSPVVDPALDEEELAKALAREYPPARAAELARGTCDRLHYFVTAGAGARALQGETPGP